MTITQATIDRLMKEQDGKCACCGRPFDNTQDGTPRAHHAVYTDNKKFSKWLDMPENLALVREDCHRRHGYLSNWVFRCYMWSDKIDQGYDMESWHDSIDPAMVRDRFVYVGQNRRKE